MHPQNRSITDQLLIDLSAFLFAAEGRVRFSDLRSSFPDVEAVHLIDALADLEERQIISLSVRHNAVFEKATRVTQNLKPLA